MALVPVGEARDHLSEFVAEVARTHERVTITRHGQPTAVLLSVADLDALEETLDLVSDAGTVAAIREGAEQANRGEYVDNDELRARFSIDG